MSKITLDSIRAAADAKFGSTDIELDESFAVSLRSPIRLGQEQRAELSRTLESLKAEDADQVKLLEKALRLLAANETAGERLVQECGGDLAVLMTLFEQYAEEQKAGEASPSAG